MVLRARLPLVCHICANSATWTSHGTYLPKLLARILAAHALQYLSVPSVQDSSRLCKCSRVSDLRAARMLVYEAYRSRIVSLLNLVMRH